MFLNFDAGRIPFHYNITSQFGAVSFDVNCDIVELSIEPNVQYPIILVDGTVDNSTCDFDVQMLLLAPIYKPQLIIFTSFAAWNESDFENYNLADSNDESLGPGLVDNRSPPANITLISSQTTKSLRALPQGAIITATSSISPLLISSHFSHTKQHKRSVCRHPLFHGNIMGYHEMGLFFAVCPLLLLFSVCVCCGAQAGLLQFPNDPTCCPILLCFHELMYEVNYSLLLY